MERVLFVFPEMAMEDFQNVDHPYTVGIPLGIVSLATVLKHDGYEAKLINLNYKAKIYEEENPSVESHQPNLTKLRDEITKFKPSWVGFHACSFSFPTACLMANSLKDLKNEQEFKIMMGGIHPWLFPEQCPPIVNHVVCGEAEDVITRLVEGKIKERIIRPGRIEDLDTLPYLDWTVIPKFFDNSNNLPMSTSRGCNFKCTFCGIIAVYDRWIGMTPQRIIDEMGWQKNIWRNQFDTFSFVDDLFTSDRKRLEEFCRLKIASGIDKEWVAFARIDRMDESLIELMARSRCKRLLVGVESGSPRILDRINKNINLTGLRRARKLLKKHGIRFAPCFIKFPFETNEDHEFTEKLIQELEPEDPLLFKYQYVPGSAIWRAGHGIGSGNCAV